MPMYDYKCRACGHIERDVLEYKDESKNMKNRVCPHCARGVMDRMPSVPGGFNGLPTPKFHRRQE